MIENCRFIQNNILQNNQGYHVKNIKSKHHSFLLESQSLKGKEIHQHENTPFWLQFHQALFIE